ncbi:M48 family metallopeptidase [Chitinophaga nivalis]|uniref:M48 family metallopeptidase n=1 Tax=Chitinophaga nivalis TaxID=2991709 RepID=A0ABT3IT02_9BACT|nr:M48 family metallopeptidase [Chitinophaga nivalis]MCW3463202.1 M48 family metallopeptidase [Chitinophaga nivalis]MCW3487108.1 M48 family metallopeptidase [Chitinophaga nivalis]
MTNLYPGSPRHVRAIPMTTTPQFRRKTIKVISCVILFFLLYVILLAAAVTLSAACIAGGILLFRANPKVLTALLSGVMILLGGMVLFFLLTFLFHPPAATHTYRTEISARHHPRLFDFIRQLVKDSHISFPRKIFVVPDVSASMCYRSGFLSIFLPVRQHLEIGLGLVNCVNISEFKMALAHEFGFFSHHTVNPASYIYLLNKRLYHLLYENDSWQMLVSRWQAGSGLFSFFLHITTGVISGMQYLLRKIYQLFNRQYQALSREMALQADTLAVSLAGTEAAVSSIRRMEMGSHCLDYCLHKIPELAERALRFPNVFTAQRELMTYYARQHHLLPDAGGLPVITDTYFHSFLKSRVQFRDQWTSHPTREAREARYLAANVSCEQAVASAWLLFDEPEHLQEEVTAQLYTFLAPDEPLTLFPPAAFIAELAQRHRLYEYPRPFNDYYDNRSFPPIAAVTDPTLLPAETTTLTFHALYHPDIVFRMRAFYRNQQDAETLQAIASGQFTTRYFEFDGIKYPAPQASLLAQQLHVQVAAEQTWLLQHDQLAFHYHCYRAGLKSRETLQQLEHQYHQILQHQQNSGLLGNQVIRLIDCISRLFNISIRQTAILQPCLEELSTESHHFRNMVGDMVMHTDICDTFPPDINRQMITFRHKVPVFSRNTVPDYPAIKELHEMSSLILEHYNNGIILLKRSYLEFILALEPGS